MRLLLLLCLGLTLTLGTGCSSSDSAPDAPSSNDPSQTSDETVTGTGTISFIELEGGFFAIKSDDGAKYDPTGSLDESFHEDGLRVRFTVTPKEGVMTTRQWGTPVDIEDIERIDAPDEE